MRVWRVESKRAHTSTMDADATSFDTPNCPQCLEQLEVTGTEQHPYLFCPSCHVAYLNRVWVH